MQRFNDPAAVARYAADTPRKVPGLADLHRMALLLLSETAPADARILVLGAGGGLELKAFAGARPQWRLVGVDPSDAMLELARQTLGPMASQASLVHGYVDDAPEGPFHGAVCLLTLHFLPRPERLHALRELRRRLAPGAALVVAHHTAPQPGGALPWLARSVAFAAEGDAFDLGQAAASARAMAQHLPLLSPADEEMLLREAGFTDIALFYAALTFRGWVARGA
ncbi:class I SAM-dependent methyltransferase [Bordetella genomosp. 13]|uniref:class I SAM-dependent methyltransferase n=1 Tax=Bordetella genomosp. 13 TaxID=463040 RepID=UPI0011A2B6E8|nr:class I SAM-dependent methyltransferase [Bordetella genomosp. 13]